MPVERDGGGTLVYPVHPHSIPDDRFSEERYELAFARTAAELDAILALRFEVFNLELGEGLEASYATGRDEDPFDAVCHHLLVRDRSSAPATIVGSYRIQTSEMASEHIGFYSAGEFDLGALPATVVAQSVEVGRACVARSHRNTQVLFLLWRGLAAYMAHNRKRYLFGCSSLTSQDPRDGAAMLRYLEAGGFMHAEILVPPLPSVACPPVDLLPEPATKQDVPPLFRIYLRHGAKIAGPPAIDREFKTIDFLTLFDVDAMPERMRRMFFGP
jgi:putative hemolysin